MRLRRNQNRLSWALKRRERDIKKFRCTEKIRKDYNLYKQATQNLRARKGCTENNLAEWGKGSRRQKVEEPQSSTGPIDQEGLKWSPRSQTNAPADQGHRQAQPVYSTNAGPVRACRGDSVRWTERTSPKTELFKTLKTTGQRPTREKREVDSLHLPIARACK